MVDHDRIAALVFQIDPGAGHLRDACDDLADPLLDELPHFIGQRSHRAPEFRALRDHVAGIAGVEFAHRNNRGFQRIDGARHD